MTDPTAGLRPAPIFFAWTRSFWLFLGGLTLLAQQLGEFGASFLLLLHDLGEPVVRALVALIALAANWDAETIQAVTDQIMAILPIALILAGWQQRMGAARPYTIDPRALK